MPIAVEEIKFKPKFIERYSKLTNWREFRRFSLMFLRRSIRVNTLKISVDDLKKRLEGDWKLDQIPWCKQGFWIEHKKKQRRDIGNIYEHALGYFYIQEAASMIPPIVLDPKPGDIILDLCAAPGSKSSQIAQYMKNKGVLVSNDYTPIRMKPLTINMQKCGISNCILTMMRGQWFKDMKFDKILVDAPCSGTGAIRKSFKTIKIWNPNMCRRLSYDQKSLLHAAYCVLRKGGTLVYSTCSLEPEENEGVVDFILKRHKKLKLEEIKLDIKKSPVVLEFEGQKYDPEIKKCLRIWPQDNDTGGFFVAKFKKL